MLLLFRAAVIGALALSLAACSASNGATTSAKTFDTICASEPALYAAFTVAAAVKGNVKAKTLATVDAAHRTVMRICAAPPKDLAQGLVQLAAAYADVTAARAAVAKKGA